MLESSILVCALQELKMIKCFIEQQLLIIKDVEKILYYLRIMLSQWMLKTNSLFSETQCAKFYRMIEINLKKSIQIKSLPLLKGSPLNIIN